MRGFVVTGAVAALLLPLGLLTPTASAAPALLTEPQIAALMLTKAQAVRASRIDAPVRANADGTYCATNGVYNICMRTWGRKADAQDSITASVFSMPTPDSALQTLSEYIATMQSAGYRPITVETNPAVYAYESERNGGDQDTVTMMGVRGSSMILASCTRSGSAKSIGPLVNCAKRLWAAQARAVPAG